MIDLNEIYDSLFYFLANGRFAKWADQVKTLTNEKLILNPHGDSGRWIAALNRLPEKTDVTLNLNSAAIEIGQASDLQPAEREQLESGLRSLMPWRKGPFNFFGTGIDTEWRSDWKWERIVPHIRPLDNHVVLDVGCGSGYHCWRMLGAGAKRVIGIDPSQLFLMQFLAVKKYLGMQANADFLPFRMEELMPNLEAFDTVFSMGVLYHRRSPIDHLFELKGALRPGGQLVLETLVIDDRSVGGNSFGSSSFGDCSPDGRSSPGDHSPGDRTGEDGIADDGIGKDQAHLTPGYALMPVDRYAMMRNVWFIPTPATLTLWLQRAGFRSVRCVNLNTTSLDEQRTTDWMPYQSLKDFLAPDDLSRTVEGYPAPLRAVMVAEKPG